MYIWLECKCRVGSACTLHLVTCCLASALRSCLSIDSEVTSSLAHKGQKQVEVIAGGNDMDTGHVKWYLQLLIPCASTKVVLCFITFWCKRSWNGDHALMMQGAMLHPETVGQSVQYILHRQPGLFAESRLAIPQDNLPDTNNNSC